jgi:hypothetical protein
VLTLNKALCQAQKMDPLNNAQGLEKARRLWEKAVPRKMTLEEACRVCHECQELGPFTFNNGNTFAAIGRTFVEDSLKRLPPVEAQIIRTTICHYIVGLIGRKELEQVLLHFESSLDLAPRDVHPPAPVPVPPTASPRGQRAPA